MAIYDYLTIDEALSLIQKNIDIIDDCTLSAKRLLEDSIEVGKIIALFKFSGFLTSHKYHTYKDGKGSAEFKQISKIKGYFYEMAAIYPSDFNSYVFCSNLDDVCYRIERAVPYEILSNEFIATHYNFWEVKNDTLNKHHAKESFKETFHVELGEPTALFNTMPIIDKELNVLDQKEPVQITKREIYFKTADIMQLINSLPKSVYQAVSQRIAELENEVATLKEQLSNQADAPIHAAIDEGQGDTLLILGAVMQCIRSVARNNYTQQSLIDAIIEKYPNTKSISQSTLEKKFPIAKKHLNQNLNS